MAPPSLVVFGPQTPCPSPEYLAQIRTSLRCNPHLAQLSSSIRGLQDLWTVLVKAQPSFESMPGMQMLQNLQKWIDGDDDAILKTPSETVLTPLTVIIHLVEYTNYLERSNAAFSHSEILDSTQSAGIQGFCTGLLSAIAVGGSRNIHNINEYGIIALRLAACIGAFVDLDGRFANPPQEFSCLAIHWTSAISRQFIENILKDYPEAYVSVVSSLTSLTVTVRRQDKEALRNHLSQLGIKATSIELSGRFHSPVHKSTVWKLQSICSADARLHFPSKCRPLVPIRSNSKSQELIATSLHDTAIRALLVETSDWNLTITGSISTLAKDRPRSVLAVGLVDCIPGSLLKSFDLRLISLKGTKAGQNVTHDLNVAIDHNLHFSSPSLDLPDHTYPEHAIAIIGMGCRFPGADSLEEFWKVIESGSSIFGDIPVDRFATENLRRCSDPHYRFQGNFLKDATAFDHRFFRKSSREAASMDPQHRLVLQVAYETFESAGYFQGGLPSKDIGCYMGVAASDYEDNVASHMPTAFSVSGMVRAFVSGKISHFFGLNGPSLVFDTACSSSAVAIHTACKAIQTGDCSMALAGGVNVITSPNLHQNLAAANFLSSTGPSKAFDANADGYCRGEGAGIVLLKGLSSALADNDSILGVISGSAINQNDNCAPITVPVSASQSTLYRRVLTLGEIDPRKVSYVEAHGTGTPKGDPIECESIRRVFGGFRERKLHFGSVKSNIGHTEAASGVAGLIKTLLMMQHGVLPKQANFTRLNPDIAPLEQSNMAILTSTQDWTAHFKAALVNNYGAAGSNAALLVCQRPKPPKGIYQTRNLSKYPIFISAQSQASVEAYCVALRRLLEEHSRDENLLPNIAFNLAQKQNRSLPYSLIFSATSAASLRESLEDHPSTSIRSRTDSEAKPVVLVFSGQSSNLVTLSKEAYDKISVLKLYLDKCNSIILSMGLTGIFPRIFERKAVQDVVELHCMIFSMQYSIAMAWLDSGLPVKTLIGHSFGQLTALCVAGAISLPDALRLICGRASLIQSKWGPEKGSMLSVNADIDTVNSLVAATRESGSHYVEVACYNGPVHFVLVGSEKSIQAAEAIASSATGQTGPIKAKRLQISNGFHSAFAENILIDYLDLAKGLNFSNPRIPVETCSAGESWNQITPEMVARQSREPVFFEEAIARIESKLGSCHWVEAGSGTVSMALAKHALADSTGNAHTFHPLNLGVDDPVGSLVETTMGLWQAGVKTQFWPFHRSLHHCYSVMNLPPYQFEKSRHWLDYVDKHGTATDEIKPAAKTNAALVTFVQYIDKDKQAAEFSIDQTSEQYVSLCSGHAVLESTLCPASLYVEIAVKALTLLRKDFSPTNHCPNLEDLEMQMPLGIDLRRKITLCLRLQNSLDSWEFTLASCALDEPSKLARHATGHVRLSLSTNVKEQAAFAHYERLVSVKRCNALLQNPQAESMQGSFVYKTFAKVVNYSEIFRGVKRISSEKDEAAGIVTMPPIESMDLVESITDPLAVDNFTQVAGLQVNSLDECGDQEIFLCTRIGELRVGSKFHKDPGARGPWTAYSKFGRETDKAILSDVFVFDSNGTLVLIILGMRFTKVMISSLRKALSRVNYVHEKSSNDTAGQISSALHAAAASPSTKQGRDVDTSNSILMAPQRSLPQAKNGSSRHYGIQRAVRDLLHRVADIPTKDILENVTMEELGIDSLMATELLSEIKETFQVEISTNEFAQIFNVKLLCDNISSKLNESGLSTASDTDDFSGSATPTTDEDTATSTPLSDIADDGSSSDLMSKLSSILAEHLDVTDQLSPDTNLGDAGLDSLLGIELGSDLEKEFGTQIDMSNLSSDSTFSDLMKMVLPRQSSVGSPSKPEKKSHAQAVADATPVQKVREALPDSSALRYCDNLLHATSDFQNIRSDYHRFAVKSGWADFRSKVFPQQSNLVLAYIVEAFEKLGCPINSLQEGQLLPPLTHQPRHKKVMSLYYHVLEQASLIYTKGISTVRTGKPFNIERSNLLFDQMYQTFPQHGPELKLLNSTGSKLAECLSGEVDPLHIMFGKKADKDLMEEVYTNSPMFQTGTFILGNFLKQTLGKYRGSEKLRILELGAGTGGTTKHIVECLLSSGIEFTYVYTDLSPSLVAAAKRKFAHWDCMEYMVLDVEKSPPDWLSNSCHVILSSNCVHATKNLLVSTSNIRHLLRQDGFLCLLELTRDLYWLDCVFGLLEGWWLFEDGREHVLADEYQWKETLLAAGFKYVDWSDDASEESDQFRLITAFRSEPARELMPSGSQSRALCTKETVKFHSVGNVSLFADIYYPKEREHGLAKRPVALMIHGGGHIMLSRSDIRPKQTQLLLNNGLLPVSVDYRLCPEVSLTDGPIPDVCTALQWVRSTLPEMKLQRDDIRPDGDKVVAVGWSTGGTLSMSLAWSAPHRGIKPPSAILAFYCPSDYEDPFFRQPNFPEQTSGKVPDTYDLLEGIQEHPITGYNVTEGNRAVGKWMSISDPRSRIALHMNWKGQTLPVILNGLPHKRRLSPDDRDHRRWSNLAQPSVSQVASISPFAQIKAGNYRTPTFVLHGTKDDLVPWEHSNRIRDALASQGIAAGTSIVEGAAHLFDLYRDPDGAYWRAVRQGYEFLLSHIGIDLR